MKLAPSFSKDLLNMKGKPLVRLIQHIVYHEIAMNPNAGISKDGDLEGHFTWSFDYPQYVRKNDRTCYRIGYTIDEEAMVVHLINVNPQGNVIQYKSRIR